MGRIYCLVHALLSKNGLAPVIMTEFGLNWSVVYTVDIASYTSRYIDCFNFTGRNTVCFPIQPCCVCGSDTFTEWVCGTFQAWL